MIYQSYVFNWKVFSLLSPNSLYISRTSSKVITQCWSRRQHFSPRLFLLRSSTALYLLRLSLDFAPGFFSGNCSAREDASYIRTTRKHAEFRRTTTSSDVFDGFPTKTKNLKSSEFRRPIPTNFQENTARRNFPTTFRRHSDKTYNHCSRRNITMKFRRHSD